MYKQEAILKNSLGFWVAYDHIIWARPRAFKNKKKKLKMKDIKNINKYFDADIENGW